MLSLLIKDFRQFWMLFGLPELNLIRDFVHHVGVIHLPLKLGQVFSDFPVD